MDTNRNRAMRFLEFALKEPVSNILGFFLQVAIVWVLLIPIPACVHYDLADSVLVGGDALIQAFKDLKAELVGKGRKQPDHSSIPASAPSGATVTNPGGQSNAK